MKRLILIATLIAGSCLNMSAWWPGVSETNYNHDMAEYSYGKDITPSKYRTYETDMSVPGYMEVFYINGDLYVTMHNIEERAYEKFSSSKDAVRYLQHDNWLHIFLWTDPADCSGIFATTHRTSFSFTLPKIKEGEYNITIDTSVNARPVFANVLIEEEMAFHKSLDVQNASRILSTDCEWVLSSLEAASPLYRLRASDNGTTLNGTEYLDILYCEGQEWNDQRAATLAYARVDNDAMYVMATPGEFPKNLWHASLEGTLDIYAAQQNETLVYDFVPRFDRQLFVYDALKNRMESVRPVSSKYLYEFIPKEEFLTEMTLDEADAQRWLNGVGAVGDVAGPFVYPVYSLDGLSPEGCMRVACLRKISDGEVIYQDEALLSAANITGVNDIHVSDTLMHASDGRLYADRDAVTIRIYAVDGTILCSATLNAGESIDLRRYAPALTIAKATCSDALQTLKLL